MKLGTISRRVSAATALLLAAPLAFALVTSDEGLWFHKVKVVRQTGGSSTSTNGWVDLPGATTTVTVPSNHEDLLIVRFAAESACSGATSWCSVRILVNGNEMEPVVGTDYSFDGTDSGTETSSSWEAHAVERSDRVRGGCSGNGLPATVTVQYRTNADGMVFRVDDWHLTVEQLHAADFVC
jgi:hypothetical protein